MQSASSSKRPLATTVTIVVLWVIFYASFTLFRPALLDDADSVHAEVAREMLLRHDYVTLYANGIRYLEKAPLLYWSMALCMRIAQLLGHTSPEALAVAARVPLALTVLAMAFTVEAFARRAFASARAGLYAALILLSSPGIFLFTRILLPDAMTCLWLTLAMLCFWLTEQRSTGVILSGAQCAEPKDLHLSSAFRVPHSSRSDEWGLRLLCYGFAAACALGVLAKGFIGAVFPVAIAAIYLLLTRGLRGAIRQVRELHPLTSTAVFLLIAAPWHVLAALHNPTQGSPGGLTYTNGHFSVPLPTDGNVHGWAWFYFVNEQVLRYLNLRVPRDYDTVPLWLFWGLCLIWLMPWSAFVFKGVASALRSALSAINSRPRERSAAESKDPETASATTAVGSSPATNLLLLVWAALPLVFFSVSTRQEYYVLPALPALAILIAGWVNQDSYAQWRPVTEGARRIRRANLRCTVVLLGLGGAFAGAAAYLLLHTHRPSPGTDLASLLQQNPTDYAMSMGHFLDLNAEALSLFRVPLAIAAVSLLLGPVASYLLRRKGRSHTATLVLTAGAFGFVLAVHLGLQTFAPVITSAQLAEAIRPQLRPNDLIVIHQEYEYGSTLGFYLQRPSYGRVALIGLHAAHPGEPPSPPTAAELARAHWSPHPENPIHILTETDYRGTSDYGRSSNLWYGSFFPDAPRIFETADSLAPKWHGPQRVFLWQDLANQPAPLAAALSPVYVIARSGGKEIVSNQPNR